VEDWFRRNALEWSLERRGQDERYFYVLVEDASRHDDDEVQPILGCVAWESGEEDDEWFIKAIAIDRRCQDNKLGEGLLMTVLSELSLRSPGGIAY
jgi:ribosomal protein S18 acetylase RimI-like enzyme